MLCLLGTNYIVHVALIKWHHHLLLQGSIRYLPPCRAQTLSMSVNLTLNMIALIVTVLVDDERCSQ